MNYDTNLEKSLIELVIQKKERISEMFIEPADFFDPHCAMFYAVLLQSKKDDWDVFAGDVLMPTLITEKAKKLGFEDNLIHTMYVSDYATDDFKDFDQGTSHITLSKELRRLRIEREKELIMAMAKSENWSHDRIAEAMMKLQGLQIISLADDLSATDEHEKEMIARQNKTDIISIKHDYPILHGMINLRKGYLVSMAGKSGTGKTTTAINLAVSMAFGGKKIVMFSMEMSRPQILDKIYAKLMRIPLRDLSEGYVNPETYKQARGIYNTIDFNIISFANKVSDIKTYLNSHPDTDVVVVDYVGLMDEVKSSKNKGWVEAMKELTFELKTIANNYNVVMFVLSQTGKKAERDNLDISDMYGSGSLENDSDVVMLINKPEVGNTIKLNVAKNRHGETGHVEMNMNYAIASMVERII